MSVLLNTNTADLFLTKIVTPGRVGPGQVVTYTLTFGNTGNWLASGAVITEAVYLPRLTQISVISSGVNITTTATTPIYTWQVQNLAPDLGGVITLTGVVSPTLLWRGWLTNTAGITGTGVDANAANNSDAADIEFRSFEIFLPVISK